ncbi:hypothetical protein DSCA_13450 [Desulfosarcina alkanivorans]|uniref:Uncharacterized protein n=1 Tax=Desulfosarcina alkanivorans TaxID=571177 RepID=A0A5K7YG06_9BACT|nr:hypothetical protein DSCA_13450 [Desulfosarcina alkanivorans]
MASFGKECGNDTAHGTGTDDGKGFGDKGLFVCHGYTSHRSGGCFGVVVRAMGRRVADDLPLNMRS